VRKELFIVAFIIILVVLLRWPTLEQPFDNDSAAIAYHARLIVRGEPLYGTHHPAHHLPAVYYIYSLAFLIFGDSLWSVKFFLLLWTIITVYTLYWLGNVLINKQVGILAAIIYTVLSTDVLMLGTTAEIELFANLPRTAGILLVIHLLKNKSQSWKYLFLGIIAGISFLFKAVYLSTLAVAGCLLLINYWSNREQTPGKQLISRSIWIGLGLGVALIPVALYFNTLGLLPRLLLVFSLGNYYVSYRADFAPDLTALFYPLMGLTFNNVAIMGLCIAGLFGIFRQTFKSQVGGVSLFSIPLWFIFSYIEAGASLTFFTHYFLLLIPTASLASAWLLDRLYLHLKGKFENTQPLAIPVLLGILILPAIVHSAHNNFDFYNSYTQYRLGNKPYEYFVEESFPFDNIQLVQDLADYITARTNQDDFIYTWSGSIQLYYLADRKSPIDIIWPLYVEATGPYQRIFNSKTKYIIIRAGEKNYQTLGWLFEELDKKYELEATLHDYKIFRRIDQEN
jgi:4-amino-4-deoxy-L-arabinose transferase-like glycosyltransferase